MGQGLKAGLITEEVREDNWDNWITSQILPGKPHTLVTSLLGRRGIEMEYDFQYWQGAYTERWCH